MKIKDEEESKKVKLFSKRKVGFVYDAYMTLHDLYEDHPERPSRLMTIHIKME